jgi:ABC-type phosphate transport system substrate-binding protein
MKRTIIAFVVIVALACTTVYAQQDVTVIAHPTVSVDAMARKDLTRIFLKKKASWPDRKKAEPINQNVKSPLRDIFASQVLGMSNKEMDSYWQGQVFSGRKSPPPTAASDREVLDFVRTTPGAVGYVSKGASTSGVKVITVTN